jgi:hypothetical protein
MIVLLSMSTGMTCMAMSLQPGKAPCSNRSFDSAISETGGGAHHVRPCQIQKNRIFMFPDSQSRRLQIDKRPTQILPFTTTAMDPAGTRSFHAGKAMLKLPPSFFPPPLFSLHCALIC